MYQVSNISKAGSVEYMANKYSYNYNPVEIDKGYLLVAGCSHAAGAEIDGKNLDSEFNRNNSFGNKLAE